MNMDKNKLRKVLNSLSIEFQEYEGSVFIVLDKDFCSDSQFEETLKFFKNDAQRAEMDCNRFFIFRDLIDEHIQEELSNDDLIDFAKIYATYLEDKLANRFPSNKFAIEIIGDDGVDDEPLELCVTFSTVI